MIKWLREELSGGVTDDRLSVITECAIVSLLRGCAPEVREFIEELAHYQEGAVWGIEELERECAHYALEERRRQASSLSRKVEAATPTKPECSVTTTRLYDEISEDVGSLRAENDSLVSSLRSSAEAKSLLDALSVERGMRLWLSGQRIPPTTGTGT